MVLIMNINDRMKEPYSIKSSYQNCKAIKCPKLRAIYLYTQVIVWVNIILYHIEMRGDFYPGHDDPWKPDKPYRSSRKQKFPPVPIPTGIQKKKGKEKSSLKVPERGICVEKEEDDTSPIMVSTQS